jgi:threonyl-tRNA synthetase
MNAKIREAQLQKAPYLLVVGDREGSSGTVAVPLSSGEDMGAMPVSEFEVLLRKVAEGRSLSLVA